VGGVHTSHNQKEVQQFEMHPSRPIKKDCPAKSVDLLKRIDMATDILLTKNYEIY
jgi:hypothetical protein